MNLQANPKYWQLSPEEKAVICNGCGPKGVVDVIPDTMWGLDISPA